MPTGARALWGQEEVRTALTRAVRFAGTPRARPVEVCAPAHTEVIAALVDLLRRAAADGVAVHWITRPLEEQLRGRGDRAGALAEADGGVVVVDAWDFVNAADAWGALREAMAFGTVQRLGARGDGDTGTDRDRGETDPARILVVLVGPDAAIAKIREADPRAAGLLRTRLDWAWDLPQTRDDGLLLVGSLRRFAVEAGIEDISPGAYGYLLEQLSAEARRGRLSTDLRSAEEALAQADVCRSEPGGTLDRRAVRAAHASLRKQAGTREEAHRRRAREGQLQIATSGSQIGVVNGLMVYGQSRQAYAMPGRITASIAVGREGLINVERESKYSGRSFDKGVFQLAGLIRSLFATRSPLGLAATLTFEQSYGRVDGDSATLAEAVALLSCAAQLPCRQDLAVSGAINPRGEVLPVGSVNLKVQGWFETCLAAGLTGTQGVVLPRINLPDLQVSEEVAAAMAAGRFTVWAVDSVDDVLELVLGVPAGRRPKKPFAPGSVYWRAGRTMRRMSERLYPPRKAPQKPKPKPANEVAAKDGSEPSESADKAAANRKPKGD
jgi:predicted ATP-dependent protease